MAPSLNPAMPYTRGYTISQNTWQFFYLTLANNPVISRRCLWCTLSLPWVCIYIGKFPSVFNLRSVLYGQDGHKCSDRGRGRGRTELLNNASKTFGGRATRDHLGELTENVHQRYWRVDDADVEAQKAAVGPGITTPVQRRRSLVPINLIATVG